MAFWRLKQLFKCVAAILLSLLLGVFLIVMNASRLPQTSVRADRREYYLYSPSSQAKIDEKYDFSEQFFLEGECSFYSLEEIAKDFESQKDTDAFAAFTERLLSTARAKIRFEEEAGGTHSYYCYSPSLKGGVILNGYLINLHIAVRDTSVAVGSPIVFGGY